MRRLFLFNPFRSLTMWGTVGLLVDFLLRSFDTAALTPIAHAALVVVSTLLASTGLRNALERIRHGLPPFPTDTATSSSSSSSSASTTSQTT